MIHQLHTRRLRVRPSKHCGADKLGENNRGIAMVKQRGLSLSSTTQLRHAEAGLRTLPGCRMGITLVFTYEHIAPLWRGLYSQLHRFQQIFSLSCASSSPAQQQGTAADWGKIDRVKDRQHEAVDPRNIDFPSFLPFRISCWPLCSHTRPDFTRIWML